jgi:hypothetical protein
MRLRPALRLHQFQRQPRRHDESNGQRNGHAHRGVDRDRAHVRPHQAGDEGHRQQRGDHRQRRQNGRPADFINGRRNDFEQAFLGIQALPAMDVFDDDNGVIDQDANRENQRKQRNAVQREAPGPGGEQRGRQRQGHGDTDDHRLAPAERKENQQHDEGGGEDQLADQLLRLLGRRFAVIARYRDFNAFRNHGVFQVIYPVDRSIGHIGRIDAGLLRNLQRHRRKLAVLAAKPGVGLGLVGPSSTVATSLRKTGLRSLAAPRTATTSCFTSAADSR